VLTARKAGRTQKLQAEVGKRRLDFETTTVAGTEQAAPASSASTPLPDEKPTAVEIVRPEGLAVTMPVGARLTDFHVRATFKDRLARDVTGQAALRLEDAKGEPAVAVEGGWPVAARPGEAVVQAVFRGVTSTAGLRLTVTDKFEVDTLRLEPAGQKLLVSQSARLRAIGSLKGKSVGDVTLRSP
jgi:hypothetical protein